MMMEYRAINCELRAVGDSPDSRKIRGRAILFEKWQRVATGDERAISGSSGKREKITSQAVRLPDLSEIVNEAMDAELKKVYRDVVMQVDHDQNKYLGSMFRRSLKLTKTDEVLDFELDVPETTVGNDLLAIMRNEGGNLTTSIGFAGRGKKSNVKKIDFEDEALEGDFLAERAVVRDTTPLDKTPLNLQEGKLSGSDFVEGVGITKNKKVSGVDWIVFRSLDLREISILTPNREPAHSGVFAQLGAGTPQLSQEQQARRWRERELLLAEATCLAG